MQSNPDSSLASAIDAYLRMYPRLAEPFYATSQCRIASRGLAEALTSAGFVANPTWVRGHQIDVPDASERALASDQHMVVRLDDRSFIDVTRRQFQHESPHPCVYANETQLKSHWRQIDDGPPDGTAAEARWRNIP